MKRFLLAILISLLLLPQNAKATISAAAVWEVRVLGSDTNGGGFVTTGTDMSVFNNKNAAGCSSCQSATVNISTTDTVTSGTATITSATANFSSALIGNIIYLSGGTGSITAVRKQVISVTNATTIVVDSSTGLTAGTGVTLNIGGALFSLGIFCGNASNGNTAYFLSAGSVFSITSATQSVSGGTCGSIGSGAIVGYVSNRTIGNTDTPWPTIQHNVASAATFNNTVVVRNFIIDCNSQTSSRAFNNNSGVNLVQENCTLANAANPNTGIFFNLYTTNNSGASIVSGMVCVGCTFHANTATPFTSGTCTFCLSDNNSGASTDGFSCGAICSISYSTAVSNGRHGFNGSAAQSNFWSNLLAVSNAGTGILMGNEVNTRALTGYAAISNGTDLNIDPSVPAQGAIALSASPFVGAPNYSLNNTAGGGAALRNTGFPSALGASGVTPTYLDIGASQHTGGGAAGSAFVQ